MRINRNIPYPINLGMELHNKPFSCTTETLEEVMIEVLNNREYIAIHERYINKKSFLDVGIKINVSLSRARDIVRIALRKLRHPRLVKRLYPVTDSYQIKVTVHEDREVVFDVQAGTETAAIKEARHRYLSGMYDNGLETVHTDYDIEIL